MTCIWGVFSTLLTISRYAYLRALTLLLLHATIYRVLPSSTLFVWLLNQQQMRNKTTRPYPDSNTKLRDTIQQQEISRMAAPIQPTDRKGMHKMRDISSSTTELEIDTNSADLTGVDTPGNQSNLIWEDILEFVDAVRRAAGEGVCCSDTDVSFSFPVLISQGRKIRWDEMKGEWKCIKGQRDIISLDRWEVLTEGKTERWLDSNLIYHCYPTN